MKKKDRIELKAENLFGFSRERAEKLLQGHFEAIKHYWKWCEKNWKKEFGEQSGMGYAKEHIERERNWLEQKEYQESILKNYAEIKQAILEKRFVVRFVGGLYWTTGFVKNNEIAVIDLISMKNLCAYRLDYNKRAYCMSVYGTSRPLEIILNYGYSLGLKFGEIPQNQQILY